MLYAYQRVMLGGEKAVFEKVTDLNRLDYFILIPLLGLIIGLGVYPQPVFDILKIAGSALSMAH